MKLAELVQLVESTGPVFGKDFTVEGSVFKAKKKQTMQVVTDVTDMPKNSVYQKTDEVADEVVTSLNSNAKEAVAKAQKGDWIACGAENERWVIKGKDFGGLYHISGSTATPIQEKSFILIKTINDISWKNAWNETKSIPANKSYYLMANDDAALKNYDWANINPMDISAFKATY